MPQFNRRFGGLTFPLGNDGALHRGQRMLLDVVRKAIESDLSGPWATLTQSTPLASAASPVESIYLIDPTNQAIRQMKPKFPALFVYEDGEAVFGRYTIAQTSITRTWCIEWVLGPLDPEQAARLVPLLKAMTALVAEICLIGGHPAYKMDSSNVHPAQDLFDNAGGGFASLRSLGSVTGAARIEGEAPLYWAAQVKVESVEVSGVNDPSYGNEPHEGASFATSGDSEGTIEDFVEFESNLT